jgi:phospholipid transport system substrate-binding protein
MKKEIKVKKIIFISMLTLILIPIFNAGAQPLETLKVAVDEAMKILDDPQYKGEAQKETQRDEIWKVIRQVFDLEGIAQITLGRNWRQFNQAEKNEFTEVFGRFLGNNYVEKIQSGFSGEKVEYLEQEKITDTKAMVKTKIVRESMEIPVDYKMHKTGADWKVYDVIIEGVSLIKNYRTQFNSFLMKKTPKELIETIKKKE